MVNTNVAPTPTSSVGGVKMSVASQSLFDDEVQGDVLVYANQNTQTIRLGQNLGDTSTMAITSNQVSVWGSMTASDFVSTVGLQLSLGTYPLQLPDDLNSVANSTTNQLAISTSNMVYQMTSLSTNANNVTTVSFTKPVSFSNAVTVAGTSGLSSTYPVNIQYANSTNVSLYTYGDVVSFSDRRLKQDIRPIEDAINKVNSISGYTFVRSTGATPDSKRMAGVVAQEIREVLPEVVDEDPSTGQLHVAYGNITALLIQATKEMYARRTDMTVQTDGPDQAFSVTLPPAPSSTTWTVAVIGACDSYSRCFAAISEDGLSVEGRCELPGKFALSVSAS